MLIAGDLQLDETSRSSILAPQVPEEIPHDEDLPHEPTVSESQQWAGRNFIIPS